MKPAAIVRVLAVIGLGALPATTCSVDRHSSEFACTSDSDCKDTTRTCDQGYCVERASNNCPSPCTSCDLSNGTCQITCNAGRPCGNVQCPFGFDCTIKCNNANACGSIDCVPGTSCDITCNNGLACGPINCGFGECSVDCNGTSACQTVDCFTSCKCDVKCNSVTDCAPPSCPPGPTFCTQDEIPGATCDSSPDGCDRCI